MLTYLAFPVLFLAISNSFSKAAIAVCFQDNIFKLDRGWLTCQSEVRLSLRGADSLIFWDSSSSASLSRNILVTPVDFGNSFGKSGQNLSRKIDSGDETVDEFSNHGECFIAVNFFAFSYNSRRIICLI